MSEMEDKTRSELIRYLMKKSSKALIAAIVEMTQQLIYAESVRLLSEEERLAISVEDEIEVSDVRKICCRHSGDDII